MSDVTDKDWSDYGYNKNLNKVMSPSDPNYMSGEEFYSSIEDSSLATAKIANLSKVIQQYKFTHIPPTSEANGFKLTVAHGLNFKPRLAGNYYTDTDTERRMLPDIRSFSTRGEAVGLMELDWSMSFGKITATTFDIELNIYTTSGFSVYIYYIETGFNFEINAFRDRIS